MKNKNKIKIILISMMIFAACGCNNDPTVKMSEIPAGTDISNISIPYDPDMTTTDIVEINLPDEPEETEEIKETTVEIKDIIPIDKLFRQGVYQVEGIMQTDGCDYFVFKDNNNGYVVPSDYSDWIDFAYHGDSDRVVFEYNNNKTLELTSFFIDNDKLYATYRDELPDAITVGTYVFTFLPDEDPAEFNMEKIHPRKSSIDYDPDCQCGCQDNHDDPSCVCE